MQPFGLLDLPQELQDLIYQKYFENVPQATFRKDHPQRVSLQLEQTCHKVCKDSREAREILWPRHLEMELISLELPFFRSLRHQLDPTWLHNRIEKVTIEYPECSTSFRAENLTKIRYQLHSLCYNLPRLKELFIVQVCASDISLDKILQLDYVNVRDPLAVIQYIMICDPLLHMDLVGTWLRALQRRAPRARYNEFRLPSVPLCVLVATRYMANETSCAMATRLDLNIEGWIRDEFSWDDAQKHYLCSENAKMQSTFEDAGYKLPKEWRTTIFAVDPSRQDHLSWVEEVCLQMSHDKKERRRAKMTADTK